MALEGKRWMSNEITLYANTALKSKVKNEPGVKSME